MVGGALPWRLGSGSWRAGPEHDSGDLSCGWPGKTCSTTSPRLEGLGISQPLLPTVGETEAPKVVVVSLFF